MKLPQQMNYNTPYRSPETGNHRKQTQLNTVNGFLRKWLPAACIAACTSVTAQAQQLTIDDFLSTPGGLRVELGRQQSTSFTRNHPGALGGTREVNFSFNYPIGVGQSSATSSLIFGASTSTSSQSGREIAGSISLPPGGGPTGDVDLEFIYFANGAGLGADLTPYPEIALLWEGDHHGVENSSFVALTLEDSLGNLHTETFSWAAGIPNDNFFIETLRWDLSDYDAGGVDLTDVDKITLTINTDESADYAFSSLTLVPEPSTSMMVALSCGVFLLRRKRRS